MISGNWIQPPNFIDTNGSEETVPQSGIHISAGQIPDDLPTAFVCYCLNILCACVSDQVRFVSCATDASRSQPTERRQQNLRICKTNVHVSCERELCQFLDQARKTMLVFYGANGQPRRPVRLMLTRDYCEKFVSRGEPKVVNIPRYVEPQLILDAIHRIHVPLVLEWLQASGLLKHYAIQIKAMNLLEECLKTLCRELDKFDKHGNVDLCKSVGKSVRCVADFAVVLNSWRYEHIDELHDTAADLERLPDSPTIASVRSIRCAMDRVYQIVIHGHSTPL